MHLQNWDDFMPQMPGNYHEPLLFSQKILLSFVIIYSRPHIIANLNEVWAQDFHKSIKFPFNNLDLFPALFF